MQRKRDFSSPAVNFCGDKNDYAVGDLNRDGVDTVGVLGFESPAPTKFF